MGRKTDFYLYAAIFLAAASMAYWAAFAAAAYGSFHEYSDLGFYALSMYYDINYPGMVPGAQALVFGQHISPDQLMLVPLYYLFSSPLTLLLAQDAVLSLTGLLVFIVAREVAGWEPLAMAMCLAYFLNPGVHGMLLFDYHAEALVMPLYILVFYFYFKGSWRGFVPALILLLGTMEVAPLIAMALGAGLGLFEAVGGGGDGRRGRYVMLGALFAMAIVAIALYNVAYYLVTSGYGAQGAQTPAFLRVNPYPSVPIYEQQYAYQGMPARVNLTVPAFGGGGEAAQPLYFYYLYGLLIVLFGFGISIVFDILPALVMLSPWLLEAFVFRVPYVVSIYAQYYGLVLGGTFVAALLGARTLLKGEGAVGRIAARRREAKALARGIALSAALALPLLVFAISLPIYLYMGSAGGYQSLLLQESVSGRMAVSQLESVMGLVPPNATLMTQDSIMPHVLGREYVELVRYPKFFVPQYILVDSSAALATPYLGGGGTSSVYGYIANNTYSLYAVNGTASLYRLEGH